MNPIKKMLWKRNAVEVVKTWFSDYKEEILNKKEQEQLELRNQIRDWSSALDASLSLYDDYIEYEGHVVYQSVYTVYSTTNEKIAAENLMWQRIHAKYGDEKVEVNSIHVPYPWNSPWVHLFKERDEMDRIPVWRLYYKVKKTS